MWHKLTHWIGWNEGEIVSRVDNDGNVVVGYRCCECGKIFDEVVACRPSSGESNE